MKAKLNTCKECNRSFAATSKSIEICQECEFKITHQTSKKEPSK